MKKNCIDCGLKKSSKGLYCKTHGYEHRKRPSGLKYTLHKENPTSFKSGKSSWNLGTSIASIDKFTGYMRISVEGRDIKYHRYVMQKHLGRKLLSSELVHHKDHNKLNNNLENLEIMSSSEHMKHHWQERKQHQYE